MLYGILRPLLFRLDAERAHELGLKAAQILGRHHGLARVVRRVLAAPQTHPVRVAGLTFPHPIGLAAGLDKNAEAPLAWWAFGFGFAELGTVTPRPQAGNERPRLFRFPKWRAIVNRMGFNNHGADVVAERLREQARRGLRPPFPLGISVGKNATTPLDRAVEDYVAAATVLAPHADFVAINVSSPNTSGLRTLQESQALTQLVSEVRAASAGRPVFVKLAPELEETALGALVDTCLAAGAAGIIGTNTLATAGKFDLPQGGLSGRPLQALSRQKIAQVRKIAGSRAAVIGCGGIDDALSLRVMLDAGADLVQLYTGLVYQGPFLPARLTYALDKRPRWPGIAGR